MKQLKLLYLAAIYLAVFGQLALAQPELEPNSGAYTKSADHLNSYQRVEERVGDLSDAPRDKPRADESHSCPYSCNAAGYSHLGCREWRTGDTCYIGPKVEKR